MVLFGSAVTGSFGKIDRINISANKCIKIGEAVPSAPGYNDGYNKQIKMAFIWNKTSLNYNLIDTTNCKYLPVEFIFWNWISTLG